MSERSEHQAGPGHPSLSEEEARIAALLVRLASPTPDARIDADILRAARRASESEPARHHPGRYWPIGGALAAVLVVSLFWPAPAPPPGSLLDDDLRDAEPASRLDPAGIDTDASNTRSTRAVEPATREAAPMGQITELVTDQATGQVADPPTDRVMPLAERAAPVAPSTPEATASASLAETEIDADAAPTLRLNAPSEGPERARTALADRLLGRHAEQPPAAPEIGTAETRASDARESEARESDREETAAGVSAPPAAPSAAPASAPAAKASSAEAVSADPLAPATGSQTASPMRLRDPTPISPPEPEPMPFLPPVERDAELAPEDWLERIRQRMALGTRQDASKSLERFIARHPDHPLPEDLAGLLR